MLGDKARVDPLTIFEGVMMICDWCGEKYPIAYSDNKNVHQLKNYANKPIVCNACYEKIRQTDVLKIFPNTSSSKTNRNKNAQQNLEKTDLIPQAKNQWRHV
jgi:hypothetical protein